MRLFRNLVLLALLAVALTGCHLGYSHGYQQCEEPYYPSQPHLGHRRGHHHQPPHHGGGGGHPGHHRGR